MNDVARIEPQRTAVDVRSHVNLIQEVMQAVMKENTHYGKIPGTPKKSLWKAGAEVLGVTFRVASSYKVDDLSNADTVRYRVICIGTHQPTGTVMGEGMGECSSDEEKYRWRSAVCGEEFDETPENRKRAKWRKGNPKPYQTKQVRTDAADLANTILKMACKRAQVAMAINVTAASDIFTQDIEDLPAELHGSIGQEDGGGEIEVHAGLKEAKSINDLVKIMNGMDKDDKLKYKAYFDVRREELGAMPSEATRP